MQQQSTIARTCHSFWRGAFLMVVVLFVVGLVSLEARGQAFTSLHSFIGPDSGIYPQAALLKGRDGALYGTTSSGGIYNAGTVFKVNPDGTGFQTLYTFSSIYGANPSNAVNSPAVAALIQGPDGTLFGTTQYGGANNYGTVFKINPDGTGFQILHNFNGYSGAYDPQAALLWGQDGTLYGTTGGGTVFRINTDGTGFQTLHTFSGSDGSNPSAGLIQGQDGALYGTTVFGGANNYGTVFKMNPDGTGFQTLHAFSVSGGDGYYPQSTLLQGQDGTLYGTTSSGTASSDTVFKINTDGTGFQTLHTFSGSDGSYPYAGLIQGQDGALYGTTVFGGANDNGTVFKMAPDGTGFQTLHTFSFSSGDGQYPVAALIRGPDGILYGTTQYGDANNYGTVFKMNPDGTGFQILQTFSVSGSDGYEPIAALLQGQDGALYGTTSDGSPSNGGTVFKVNIDGTGFQILHTFIGSNGYGPQAALIQGRDGALYGTTSENGEYSGGGTVFKVNPDGTGFQILHTFSYDGPDGRFPAALLQGQDGALYGTTSDGGVNAAGTVFKVNPDGTGFQILYSLSGFDQTPESNTLIQGQDGALYGTTEFGGANYYAGTVFKMNSDGSGFQILHNFSGSGSDGSGPRAALLQGQDGTLYGTTFGGGEYGWGAVFRINTDGTAYQTLYSFSGGSDGGLLQTALIHGQDGALYGTTEYVGGDEEYTGGTVFKINTDGTGFQTLYTFSGSGFEPIATLTQGLDGNLYGTTEYVGDYGLGSVFKLALVTDVTSKVQVSSSGLTYNAATKLYTGTLTIKNNNQLAIAGPIQAALSHLPSGVTLVNANGTYNGAPYVTANIASLAPRGLIHLTLQFSVTSGSGRIGYSIKVYSGTP